MKEKVDGMESRMGEFRELLNEAAGITLLLEENLELAKEERNTLYAVKALRRTLKGMQGMLSGLPERVEETF
ncbi:MAG: hypothetical protein HFI69_11885 [Lachnospiraceae bacterium]|nr:hypothetical protein [Lachnospiraceae bacterium]